MADAGLGPLTGELSPPGAWATSELQVGKGNVNFDFTRFSYCLTVLDASEENATYSDLQASRVRSHSNEEDRVRQQILLGFLRDFYCTSYNNKIYDQYGPRKHITVPQWLHATATSLLRKINPQGALHATPLMNLLKSLGESFTAIANAFATVSAPARFVCLDFDLHVSLQYTCSECGNNSLVIHRVVRINNRCSQLLV